jgi:hypothetical protein
MKKLILICGFLILANGCGPRLVYPNLEWLIPLYVDDYVSLNRKQSTMLEKRLSQQLEWHCRTQLPLYAESLKELARDLHDPSHPIGDERIRYYHDKFLNHWQDLMRQIAPDIAAILKIASEAQLDELFQNIEKENQEYRSKFVDLPPAELAQKRQEKTANFLERWLSRLNAEQKRDIADWSAHLEPFAADQLQYRETILAEFQDLFQRRGDDADYQNSFTELLLHPERMRSAKYQKKVDYNTDVTIKFLVKIERSLTATQRAYLVDRIESLAADFDKLSCDPTKVKRKTPLS